MNFTAGAPWVADLHGIHICQPVTNIDGTSEGSDDSVPRGVVPNKPLNIEPIDERFDIVEVVPIAVLARPRINLAE